MGAWIETCVPRLKRQIDVVAPYVGAWIETVLKMLLSLRKKSHPMWVRGLKHIFINVSMKIYKVAPYVGAWIETEGYYHPSEMVPSHPMWVRGLKHPVAN